MDSSIVRFGLMESSISPNRLMEKCLYAGIGLCKWSLWPSLCIFSRNLYDGSHFRWWYHVVVFNISLQNEQQLSFSRIDFLWVASKRIPDTLCFVHVAGWFCVEVCRLILITPLVARLGRHLMGHMTAMVKCRPRDFCSQLEFDCWYCCNCWPSWHYC